MPYHLVNIALHATNGVLVFLLLRRLRIPVPWLVAILWALHPVNVESVVWIAELKNTQSGFFFFLSVLCFLRFDASAWCHCYGLALLCGLAALTVVEQRGHIHGTGTAEWNLGMALVQTGRIEEAIAHFQQALRIRPDLPEVRYNLGSALAQVGRVPEAIAQYKQALRIKPDFAEARNALVRLQAGQ